MSGRLGPPLKVWSLNQSLVSINRVQQGQKCHGGCQTAEESHCAFISWPQVVMSPVPTGKVGSDHSQLKITAMNLLHTIRLYSILIQQFLFYPVNLPISAHIARQ